jgi:3-oxoacyl-[acyl-carrier-protein] synthase-1
VLQREEETDSYYCRLAGYANRNDAHHQTASSVEGNGAFLAMSETLAMAGVAPHEIDYINAHGTGTGNNDASESAAFVRLFGEKVPAFSSTKGFTGHTLAAAGGIEAVLSVLAIKHNCLYPNLNFESPIEEFGLVPVCKFEEVAEVNSVLTNSFGFGGNCSSLLFTR